MSRKCKVEKKTSLCFKTQEGAMRWLRKNNPEFFEDPEVREVAVVVVLSMAEEMSQMTPVQRVSFVSGTMILMYMMGKAAVQSIRDYRERKMGRILADNFRELEREKVRER